MWRKEFLRLTALDAALRLVSGVLIFIASFLWLDAALVLPQRLREVLLAAGGAAFALALFEFGIKPWRRFQWAALLDAAAREFPQLKDYLRTAWDLQNDDCSNTSEDLRKAHLEQTELLLKAIAARPVFPWRPSRWARRGALAAAFGGFTLPLVSGGAAWQRVLAPWRDMPLERFLSVAPGDARIDWGGSVEISARWIGAAHDRQNLKLWLRAPGAAWRVHAWDRVFSGGVGCGISQLTEKTEYRFSWRDMTTRSYRLTPVAAPQLVSLRARIHSPRQAPAVSVLSPGEPLEALRGSWVSLTGQANQPLAKALLKISSLPLPIVLKRTAGEGENAQYEGGFSVQEDAAFLVEVEASDGRKDPRPLVYRLKALADQPPEIELLSPLTALQAGPADTIPIAYSARDDFGLARILLLIGPAGEKPMELPLRKFGAEKKPATEFLGDFPWELDALLPGTKAEFQLKVIDNASPPQSALSAKGSVEIIDFQAGHAEMERRLLQVDEKLDALALREEQLRELLSSKNADELEGKLAGLPEAWKEAVKNLFELAQSMDQDAYANPGLSEQARQLAAELAQAEKGSFQDAMKSSRQGDFERAAKQHGRLAQKLRKTQKLLREGAKVQSIQDFHAAAGRMSQAGSQLEAALDALMSPEGAKTVSQEDLAKLESALSQLQKQMESLQKTLEALPKPLPGPEDDSRKTYTAPLQSARRTADALGQALARGDFAAAAKIAKKLAEQLAQIQKAVSEAGQQQAGGASSSSQAGSARMEKAQALWSEVVADQSKLMDATQSLEQGKMESLLAAQKDLLAGLAKEQAALVSSAAVLGNDFPVQALGLMKTALSEFESGKIKNAPAALGSISGLLRQPPKESRREWFASAEDEIRRKLESAPQAPAQDKPDAESQMAAQNQARTQGKTEQLQKELEGIEADVGTLPRGTVDRVEKAQAEQKNAEAALRRGDSASGLRHQEKALEFLEQGKKEMEQSAQSQQKIESGMGEPFKRPSSTVRSASGGGPGSKTGFVALPSAKDYRPPQEIREELQRSLRERRPASYDRLIKEYFKRIAQ